MDNYEVNVENECKHMLFVREFQLPNFVSTLKYKLNHKLLEHPERKTWMKWVYESSSMTPELFKRIQGLSDFVALYYPLSHMSRYEITFKFFAVVFVCYDLIVNESETHDRNSTDSKELSMADQYQEMLDKLQDKSVPMYRWKPCIMAQFATFEPIYQSFNEVQKRRFIHVWELYIQGLRDVHRHYHENTCFNCYEEIIEVRNKCSRAGHQAIEYCNDLFISEKIWESPDWQLMLELAAKNICMVNDVYSFEKEYNQKGENLSKIHNLVAFLVDFHECSLKEGMDQALLIIEDNERQIHDIEEKILRENKGEKDVEMFIKCLNYSCGGNYQAHQFLDRYNKL